MKNTDFFRVRTYSLNQDSSRPTTKNTKNSKPMSVYSNEKRGIQRLLEGSSKSHCNTFIGYSRIPHKYDHFHERTIPSSALSSLLHSNPKKTEPPKNLLDLSEKLDLNKAQVFFREQHVYSRVFEINRISPTRKSQKPKKSSY